MCISHIIEYIYIMLFTDTLERNNLLGNRNNSNDNDLTIYGEQIPPYDVLNTKCVSISQILIDLRNVKKK